MATPITAPQFPENQPYCQVSDVLNLIGYVGAIVSGQVTTTQIQSAIKSATSYVEAQTSQKFAPYRRITLTDGNGRLRMQFADRPILFVNSLSVYISYPWSISQISNDWSLLIDRASGTITYPQYADAPFFSGISNTFWPMESNIQLDAWYGYTRSMFGDTLSTTDGVTFPFTYATAAKQTCTVAAIAYNQAPTFWPIIYQNGVPLVNTTYVLSSSNSTTVPSNQWEIAQDNIYYTLTPSVSGGYSGVTFNTAPSGIITADYPYVYIPEDIVDITAKKAAITVLSGIATNGGLTDTQFQGSVETDFNGGKVRFNDTLGKWGHQMTLWQSEIAQTIAARSKVVIGSLGIGSDRTWRTHW